MTQSKSNMSSADGSYETDLVSREIIRGKLLAVADEMGIVLKRSSMSPVIYEVLDFACGFCDASGSSFHRPTVSPCLPELFQSKRR